MRRCQHDGERFGIGHEPCQSTETSRYSAGAYGTAWLCDDHRIVATRLCDDADGAMRESSAALAQQFRDERAMAN